MPARNREPQGVLGGLINGGRAKCYRAKLAGNFNTVDCRMPDHTCHSLLLKNVWARLHKNK